MENKRAVVTGGAGFIGSHLVEELVANGYQVAILDDLSTGKKTNIEPLLPGGRVDFVRGSVVDLPLLQGLFQNTRYVFHLAAISSVPRSLKEPRASHEVNATGTLNVLLASRDNNVSKVIYASSSAVYGDTPTLPQKEDMVPRPLSPYAAAKLAGEHYCAVFQEVYGLPTVCLRYFNVYGPRQDPDSQYAAVVPRFIKRCYEGNPPIVFGDGEQTRDFTFVRDAVMANIRLAESDARGVFNISRGECVTINLLAKLIAGLVGTRIEPIYQEARVGDIKHSLADITKARAFGYEPQYNLEQGLRETIAHRRNLEL
ncbi:MAG TPA: SDR family oxidoreductase [Dehalococcoidales bacterium]